jgi:hypothetical protein
MSRIVRPLWYLVAILAVVCVTPASAAGRRPDVLSPTLSYYFVPGNAFQPSGASQPYSSGVDGCLSYVNRNAPLSAPVYLPPASQVVSITLYSYNNVLTTTIGMLQFVVNDGLGSGISFATVTSTPNEADYQQTTGSVLAPVTIDYEKYSYSLWFETQGDAPSSQGLAVCGVRVAYYAPGEATFLPVLTNP